MGNVFLAVLLQCVTVTVERAAQTLYYVYTYMSYTSLLLLMEGEDSGLFLLARYLDCQLAAAMLATIQ